MQQNEAFPLNDKKVINGWALFDWANSAFSLVITVAIFPTYFLSVTTEDINILGMEIPNGAVLAYCLSAGYLIIALFSPLLSGIADYGGKKKFFLRGFTYLGATACMLLFFFEGMDQFWLGAIAFIFGLIGFAGGFVFYNSYLPEIVTEDKYDMVSAKGFALGFLGSMILLVINLLMIMKPTWFGIPEGTTLPARISFLMVGLWWLGFSTIPFRRLPDDQPNPERQEHLLKKGMQELRKVWRAVKHQFNTKTFLISFFFYSAGVQTVLYLASAFAEQELHFESQQLISIILLLQLVGIAGAFIFAKLSEWKGNKFSLITMLVIWLLVCLAGYFLTNQTQFYFVAAAVGMAMGGTQSLSRATYSKIIPADAVDLTSYFSFYDVLEKVATVLGTFIFAFVTQLTGSMRLSMLVLAVFFIAGIVSLLLVRITRAQATGDRSMVVE